MTIHSMGGGEFSIVCDQRRCGYSEELDAPSFPDVVARLQEDKWKVDKDPATKVWSHTCPSCAERLHEEKWGLKSEEEKGDVGTDAESDNDNQG